MSPQPAPLSGGETGPEDAPAKEVFEPADIDKQNMPTEHVSGPSTAEFIQCLWHLNDLNGSLQHSWLPS